MSAARHRRRILDVGPYVVSSYAVWRCWSAWCRARCARGVAGLKRAILPPPSPPCQIPRRTVSSGFTNCSTRVFDQKCCEISPWETPPPLLRNPALLHAHSGPTQSLLRKSIVASGPLPPPSMREVDRVTVNVMFTTRGPPCSPGLQMRDRGRHSMLQSYLH